MEKKPCVSRRAFLQGATASLAGSLVPGTARAVGSLRSGQLMATLIDIDACTGCGKCVEVCRRRAEKLVPVPDWEGIPKGKNGEYPRDWSEGERRAETSRLTPYTWLTVQTIPVETATGTHTVHVPRRCMHCVNPSCAWMCPSGALTRETSGAVHVLNNLCTGEGGCVEQCPWHIPMRQGGTARNPFAAAGKSRMFKCDFCCDLQEDGKIPLCVSVCTGATQFGPYEEIVEKARALAAERGVKEIFGLEENGGTTTLYVSSYSLRDLEIGLLRSQGIGPGRPTFRIRKRPMQQRHVHGLVGIAPLVGIGLASLRLWRDHEIHRRKE